MSWNDEPVVLVSKRDGRVVERFPSVSAAARKLRLSRGGLLTNIDRLALPSGENMCRLERLWTGSEVFKEGSNNKPVIVSACGRLQWFPCKLAAAEALHLTEHALGSLLSTGRRRRDGLAARYAASTEDWPRLREALTKGGDE